MRCVKEYPLRGHVRQRVRPIRFANFFRAVRATTYAAFPLVPAAALVFPAIARAGDNVQITLQGTIQSQCSVSASGSTVRVDNLAASGSKTVPLTVNCNAPFSYQLVSSNGGFKHTVASSAPNGFLVTVPYNVEIRIPTDDVTIEDACSSTSIIASGGTTCAFGNSGNGVSIGRDGQGSLTLTWAPGAIPLSGSYYDRLELRVITSP